MPRSCSCVALLVATALGAAALCAPSVAQAQGTGVDRTAAARALFEEGIARADAGDWEAAADRFQRAFTLRPTPQIMFNFAGALIELGALVRASELLLRVSGDEAADRAVREAAEARREDILPRIARLTVRLGPGFEDAGVTLDQRRIEPAALGVEVPVDPGAHRVSLVVDGETAMRREIELAEGERRELHLAPDRLPAATAESDVTSEPWFWATWIGGVVLVAGAITLGVVFATEGPQPFAGSSDPPTLYVGGP